MFSFHFRILSYHQFLQRGHLHLIVTILLQKIILLPVIQKCSWWYNILSGDSTSDDQVILDASSKVLDQLVSAKVKLLKEKR